MRLDKTLDPLRDPQNWDVITIGGIVSPGVARLGDVGRSYEWDVKVGKGAFGGTTTFTGRVPAKFSVSFSLWRSAHFGEWAAFVRALKYDPTKITYSPDTYYTSGVSAVDIYHPSLVFLDIRSVVVEKVGGIVHQGKGIYEASVSFIEWYPPPKRSTVATPAKSTDVPTGVVVPSAVAIAQAEAARLVAILEKP